MTAFQAIVLGVVQGLTEFLPISSSAHLVIVPWLFGWPQSGLTFDVCLHVGTLGALIVYFGRDWWQLAQGAWRRVGHGDRTRGELGMLVAIALATIPAGVAGLLGESTIERIFHADDDARRRFSMLGIAAALALLGIALGAAERFARHRRNLDDLRLRDAMWIGCAQALALFPGVSRSGATLTAGLGLGFTREAAARFSFLLATPITAAAAGKKLLELAGSPPDAASLTAIALGTLASLISGLLAIHGLLHFLRRYPTWVFVGYRLALATVIVILALKLTP